MAEKVGKDQPEGRDFCVSIFGFNPDPKMKDKEGNPLRFHYADDYKWFISESDAANFVNDKSRLTDYLYKKTKIMRVLTDCWNNDKKFFQIVGVIVKKKLGDGKWMYLLKHEKEIVIEFPKKKNNATDKIIIEQEKDPGGRSASVIRKSY